MLLDKKDKELNIREMQFNFENKENVIEQMRI